MRIYSSMRFWFDFTVINDDDDDDDDDNNNNNFYLKNKLIS